MHCRRFLEKGLTRRDMLLSCGNGFGALAAAALFCEPARAAAGDVDSRPHDEIGARGPLSPRPPTLRPRRGA